MADWSFQGPCIDRTIAALEKHKKVVFCSPTGSGKTKVTAEIIAHYLNKKQRVAVYTDRRIMREQLVRTLAVHGFQVGTIAAGLVPDYERLVQVCMVKTVKNRPQAWAKFLDSAGLVIIDEAHKMKSNEMKTVLHEHSHAKADILGITATPISLSRIYNHLVLGPSPRELEQCGVIVPIDLYAPSEIDMGGIKIDNTGEYNKKQVEDRLKEFKDVLIGDVVTHWRRLNPYELPTVCFAPSVDSSRWLAEMFRSKGITSEHIDADTTDQERADTFARWKSRETKIVTNFGILTEGFDFPGMFHCILARPMRSIANYIQIIGRVRRSYAGKTFAIVQDHVGNYYRHPKALYYHDWRLDENAKNIAEKLRKKPKKEEGEKEEPTPINCMECDLLWTPSREQQFCPGCGSHPTKPMRKVRQKNGKLDLKSELPSEFNGEFQDEKILKRAIYIVGNRQSSNLVSHVYGIAASNLGRKVDAMILRKPQGRDWSTPAREFWHELFDKKSNHTSEEHNGVQEQIELF